MKILQIATYISPDNSYGGPVRVALNQSKELSSRGHNVKLIAAGGGFPEGFPDTYDNFPVTLYKAHKLIPGTGFAGLVSPKLTNKIRSFIEDADVIHIHLARDLITLPAAVLVLCAKKPLVTQTHGMIDPSTKPLARPLDKLLTIPVLRYSSHVLYLRSEEKEKIGLVAGSGLETHYLPNGTPLPQELAVEQRLGPQKKPEVLYMARLHAIKRPHIMIEASYNLLKAGSCATFTMAGPDEGEASKLQSQIASIPAEYAPRMMGAVPPDKTLSRLRKASIYVLPSIDETFPMSVLEAMSIGLPVIITRSCGLAKFVESHGAGITCGPTTQDLEAAINQLIENPALRISMGHKAKQAVADFYSIGAIANSLEKFYKSSIADTKQRWR